MKTKLLPILLIILVILNGVLIFMLIKKPHERGPHERGQRNFLTTQLHFSKIQKEQFRDLEAPHRGYMIELDTKIIQHKDFLFRSFSAEKFSPDSITRIIGSLEARKEAEVFHFFQKVRNICNEKQLKPFDEIIKKALSKGRRRAPHEGSSPRPMDRGHPPRRSRQPPM